VVLARKTLSTLGALLGASPLLFAGWAGLAHAQGSSAAAADPVATVRCFDRRLRHALARHVPAWSPEAGFAQMQIRELVDEMMSVPDLARGTLGRHWVEADDRQRQAFLDLFRGLLVTRIASGELLAFTPETAPKLTVNGEGVADVSMVVRELGSAGGGGAGGDADDARRASIDYRLRFLSGRWQLIDLLVNDQSVVREYREQFDEIIAREKIEGLLLRMRKKLG
jgi:ABC-type transporter MlaC component